MTIQKYRENSYKHTARINMSYGNEKESFAPEETIIILKDSRDGFTGDGILKTNEETLKLALDEQDYTSSILKNGALPIGVLKSGIKVNKRCNSKVKRKLGKPL